jgi:hypothetical protein
MRPGEQYDCFPAAVASLLSTRDTPLCDFEGAFGLAIPAGGKDARATGQGSERLDAKIYPGLLSGGRQRPNWRIHAGEAGIPPVCFSRNRDGLDHSLNRTGPTHRNTPDLGENQNATI